MYTHTYIHRWYFTRGGLGFGVGASHHQFLIPPPPPKKKKMPNFLLVGGGGGGGSPPNLIQTNIHLEFPISSMIEHCMFVCAHFLTCFFASEMSYLLVHTSHFPVFFYIEILCCEVITIDPTQLKGSLHDQKTPCFYCLDRNSS